MPAVCDSIINASGLTSSVPATAFCTPNSLGVYTAYAVVLVTVPALTGGLTLSLSWSNGLLAASESTSISSTVDLTAASEHGLFLGTFYAIPEQPIMYSTSLLNVTGPLVYALKLRLLYLG